MKLALITLATVAIGTLAFGLGTESKSQGEHASATSRAFQLGSPDGKIAITITSDALPSGQGVDTPRILKVFGAHIDPTLGLINTSLQSFGTLQSPLLAGDLPATLTVDLGETRALITPKGGTWASVSSEADLETTFVAAQ